MIATSTQTPYQERRTQIALSVAPHVAISAVDSYVAAGSALALPFSAAMHPAGALSSSVVSSAGSAMGAVPFVCCAMGVAHGIAGLVYLFSDSPYQKDSAPYKARRLKALGELITGAGLAAQAGVGIWAVPITAVGVITTLSAQISEARHQ